MLTRTFKVRFQAPGRDDEVRRFTLEESGLTLDTVRARAKQLFKLEDSLTWFFRWVDEDNDKVVLTENYEFEDLLNQKRNEQLIRLEVYVEPVQCPPADFSFVGRHGKHFHHGPHPHHGPGHHGFHPHHGPGHHGPHPHHGPGNFHRGGPRFGARCDVTNKSLEPGTGAWYHKPNTRDDLCPEEFNKLSDEEKSKYVLINEPKDLAGDRDAYKLKCPYRGARRGRVNNQEQSDNEPDAIGWCDVTDVALKVGKGWYHKVGTTYDLCESAFHQLPEEDKQAFVRVDHVQDLGEESHRYVRFPMMLDLARMFHGSFPERAPEAPVQATPVPAPPAKEVKTMEVVSGPSVLPGAKVKTGARLMPVWEVKNTASAGLWTDVRLKPTVPNTFKVSENGVEVPMLEAGSSGIVSVDFVVPEDHSAGVVNAEFVMVDGEGEVFGQPLVLSVEVIREEAVVDEKVRLLLDMGFPEPKVCAQALSVAQGDVNAAVLALLRGSR